MKANPHLGSSLSSLLKRSFEEKDIVKICRISEMYPWGIVAVIQKYKKENEKLRAENKSLNDKVEDLQTLNNKAEKERYRVVRDEESTIISQLTYLCLGISRYYEIFLRFAAVCIWAANQASFYHETIGNDKDDDKAGEHEDETRSNIIDEQ